MAAQKKSKATSSTPSTNQKSVPAAGKPKGVAKSRAKAAPKQGTRRKCKKYSTKEVAKEEPRGFKDLAGELRNKIYSYVFENYKKLYGSFRRFTIVPMVLAQQAQPQQQQTLPQAEAILVLVKPGLDKCSRDSDKAMRSEMIAFSHATGWIHKEFQKYRAEQIQRTHVYVHIKCLDKFIKKFPLAGAHPAKLTVFFDDDYKQGTNILPLMEFLQRNPTTPYDIFTLNSQDRTVRDENIHAMVFGPLRNALVNDPRVFRVSYTCFRHLKTLKVWARSEREEDAWIGNTKEQTWKPEWWNRRSGEGMTEGFLWTKAKQDVMRKWLQQAGADLSLMAGWHVTVGS